MSGNDSSNIMTRDVGGMSAVQILQDDIVAYLQPMFPYLTETKIRGIVVSQSRLLADPLDKNRLTNSCIDELLNPDIFGNSPERRMEDSGGYIDLTSDPLVPEKFESREAVIDEIDVGHSFKEKPLSDLNQNNSGQIPIDCIISSDWEPESTDLPAIKLHTEESRLRVQDSGNSIPESRVEASQKLPVNISAATVETSGASAPREVAYKQRSSPKHNVSATLPAGPYQVRETPSNGTGMKQHRKKPSQAPSTMSKCPCGDCQALPSPSSWQESNSNSRNDQLQRTVSSHQEPHVGSPLATTKALGQTGFPRSNGQPHSVSGTQSNGARQSIPPNLITEVHVLGLPVLESKATNSDGQKAKEKQQHSGNWSAKFPVKDIKKETGMKPHPKSSETVELFWQSVMKKASSKSSTPPRPGATIASFSGPQSTPGLASPAAVKENTKTDYEKGGVISSSSVDPQSRPSKSLQPSASSSVTDDRSTHQYNFAIKESNLTCTQRLYKKPTSEMQPAIASTSAVPTTTSVRPTLPAKSASLLPGPSVQPAQGMPGTKRQLPSLSTQSKLQAQSPAKQPRLITAQTQAGSSHQRLTGQTPHQSLTSPAPSKSSFIQKPKITASTQAESTLVLKGQLTAPASKSVANLATSSSASSVKPSHPPQVKSNDQASTNHQAAVTSAAVTSVPNPHPQLNALPNWAVMGQIPLPLFPNPLSQMTMQPVTNALPVVTFQQPQINPVVPGHIPLPNIQNPQVQPVVQEVANPLPPVTVHQPEIRPANAAAGGGIPPHQLPNPEPQPVIPGPAPAPMYQPPQAFPAQGMQPANGKTVEDMKAEVLVLFPEAEPAYVLTRLEEMKDYPSPTNQVCNHLLENPSYPRAKKEEAPSKPTKSNAQENKVDYIKDYYKLQGSGSADVLLQLQNDFRMLSMETIRRVWMLHFYNYAPTRVCLEEVLRTNTAVQRILPRVKQANHCERKIPLEITVKNAQGKDYKTSVNIHLLKGLRHPFYQDSIKTPPDLKRHMDFYQQHVKNSALEKDLLLALSMNENEYEAEGQLIECGCCYAEVTFEKMIQCLDGHLFCESCLQMYAKQAVYGQGKAALTCMTDGCDSSYPRDQLEKVLSSTDMAKYDERVQEESIQLASMDGLVRCPYCDFAALLDPGDKVFSCQNPKCSKETCRHCGEDWKDHFGKRCEEVEKKSETNMRLSYEERMSQLQIRTCHRCKTGIMKDQGCNKMTCRCGAKMCYICRKPNIDYNHFCSHARNPGQGCTQCIQCSLWTDPAEDDARAVKELEKELQMEREKLARAEDSRGRLGPAELAPEAKKQRVI